MKKFLTLAVILGVPALIANAGGMGNMNLMNNYQAYTQSQNTSAVAAPIVSAPVAQTTDSSFASRRLRRYVQYRQGEYGEGLDIIREGVRQSQARNKASRLRFVR